METYSNFSGRSGVAAYEISSDSITVQFKDAAVYLYNYGSAGSSAIEQMKVLAKRGIGLNSYISTTVKEKYAAKLRSRR